MLPWDVESLCYSALDLAALSALLRVSKTMQSQVVRRLKTLKCLLIEVDAVCRPGPLRLALSFARKHCQSLAEIRSDDESDMMSLWRNSDELKQFELWLRPIIQRNHRTLTTILSAAPWSHETLLAMTHCALLEQFHFFRVKADARTPMHMSDTLCDRITIENLPRLRSLTLTTHADSDFSSFEELVPVTRSVRILRNGVCACVYLVSWFCVAHSCSVAFQHSP